MEKTTKVATSNAQNNIDKWVVIAKCTDGDVLISKDGEFAFDIEMANTIAKEHQNMGAEIKIIRYGNI